VIQSVTFFVGYTGPRSACTQYSGDSTPCTTEETLPFEAKTFNYDFACATHTFQWDFDDGQTGSGRTTTHRYVNAVAYNLKLTIGVNGQAYLVAQTVKVASGSGTGPGPDPNFGYDFSSQPIPGVTNGYVFTAFAKSTSSSTATTYNWDFGDGQTCIGCGATQAHVYQDSKSYTVTLSVPGVTGSVQHPATATGTSRHRPSHP